MSLRSSRGFTLVELLVALVLLVMVGGSIYQVLVNQQRLSRAQSELVALQTNVRTGALLLGTELRELATGPAGSDILQMGGDSISYRAMRGTVIACQRARTEVRVLASPFYGFRQPQAGRDSLLLFVEGDSTRSTDDRWVALPITSVTGGSTCGARAATVLATDIDTIVTPLSAIKLDAPARTFEVMQLKLYQSGGQYWLGARSASAGETIQPVLGPLLANGLALTYLDSTGVVTTNRQRVRTIQIMIRGVTDRTVRTAASAGQLALVRDSLAAQVTLRNAPRF